MITPPAAGGHFVGGFLDAPWFLPGGFEGSETRRFGARPRWPFTFFPHYFLTGVTADSGDYLNCTFAAVDRIQVNPGAATASWTGPDREATVGRYPAAAMISWTENLTGYSVGVEYKTAASQDSLAAASWEAAVNGGTYNLYRWYKLRVSWAGFRCLAQEEIDPENPRAAFATETPAGPNASFATEGTGGPSYIEGLTLEGEFPINAGDVVPEGQISQQLPLDFSDLGAGDYTFKLLKTSGLYDHLSPNFLFYSETNWWGKNLRVCAGYQRPGTQIIDSLKLYEGRLMTWGRPALEVDATGRPTFPGVEIYTRDLTAVLLNQRIGMPDSDGVPQPFVRGRIVADANELAAFNPFPPVREADFETGDLSQLSGYETTAHGTVAITTDHPYRGTYCCRTRVDNAANERAVIRQDLEVPAAAVFFQGNMYVAAMPAVPEAENTRIAGVADQAGNPIMDLYVDNDTRLWVKHPDNCWWDTDYFLAGYTGQHVQLTIGLLCASPGLLKVWLNDDEIFSKDDHPFDDVAAYSGWVGPRTGPTAETWDIYWDGVKIWNTWNPSLYQVYGGPYRSIDAMYVDGVVTPQEILNRSKRQRALDHRLKTKVRKGRKAGNANYVTYPELGAVAWLDYANPPSGAIRLGLTKDDITHPVDHSVEIIAACGHIDKINNARAAAAKAATPNDSIGVYFENIHRGRRHQADLQPLPPLLLDGPGGF